MTHKVILLLESLSAELTLNLKTCSEGQVFLIFFNNLLLDILKFDKVVLS